MAEYRVDNTMPLLLAKKFAEWVGSGDIETAAYYASLMAAPPPADLLGEMPGPILEQKAPSTIEGGTLPPQKNPEQPENKLSKALSAFAAVQAPDETSGLQPPPVVSPGQPQMTNFQSGGLAAILENIFRKRGPVLPSSLGASLLNMGGYTR